MGKIRFKLQNIVFEDNNGLGEKWKMMYRGDKMIYNKLLSAYTLKNGQFVEFFTYFNACPVAKWRKYTKAEEITLNLVCKGDFLVTMFGHYTDGSDISKEFYDTNEYHLKEKSEISITVPKNIRSSVVGFQIAALSSGSKKKSSNETAFYLYEGNWSALIDKSSINDIRIALTTVTFKKEEYITCNMELLERELFYTDEPAKDHIKVRIIDNGRTLDPEDFKSEYMELIHNENTGGSGGYTRGMIEAINDKDFSPTHVLLMDDDVMVLPEAFVRTYSYLALLKPEYDERYLSGAMLFYERMNVQHEDIGFVHDDGSYGPNKPDYNLQEWDAVLRNEQDINYHPNSYAGWWYCCVPVKKIKRDRLPLPLFIRGDDVEFSLANNAEFLSLNGICIWHRGFSTKFNACLELYMVHRNSLIIQAVSGICKGIDFAKRIDNYFWRELYRLSYNNCELLLDAVEEYCSGPEFLFKPEGERIMKEHAKKNEKMYPVATAYRDIPVDFSTIYTMSETPLTDKEMRKYEKTCNGQAMPSAVIKDKVAVIAYDWFYDPAKHYMADKILAVNAFDHTAYLRTRDKARFEELVARRDRVMDYYEAHKSEIEQQYAEAGKILKTEKFWREYLKMPPLEEEAAAEQE